MDNNMNYGSGRGMGGMNNQSSGFSGSRYNQGNMNQNAMANRQRSARMHSQGQTRMPEQGYHRASNGMGQDYNNYENNTRRERMQEDAMRNARNSSMRGASLQEPRQTRMDRSAFREDKRTRSADQRVEKNRATAPRNQQRGANRYNYENEDISQKYRTGAKRNSNMDDVANDVNVGGIKGFLARLKPSGKGKQKKQMLSKKERRKRRWKRFGIGFAAFLLVTTVSAAIYLIPIQKRMSKEVAEKIEKGFNSSKVIVYAADGETVIDDVFPGQKKEEIKKADIPDDKWNEMVHSVIDVEDADFYNHSGISYKSLAGAVVYGIKNGNLKSRGGSTITQQLVKLYVLENTEKTLSRKIDEAVGAKEFEKQMEKKTGKGKAKKDKILELYLNTVNYANGSGIQTAAKGYFKKDAKDLDLAQIAYLSSIPNNPGTYDPYGATTKEKQDPNYVNQRTSNRMKNVTLNRMVECGTISGAEKQKIIDEIPQIEEEIKLRKNEEIKKEEKVSFWVRDYIKDCILEEYIKVNNKDSEGKPIQRPKESDFNNMKDYQDYKQFYNDEYVKSAEAKLFSNSQDIIVKTSIDLDKQAELQNQVDETMNAKDTKTLYEARYESVKNKYTEDEDKIAADYFSEADPDERKKKAEEISKALNPFNVDNVVKCIKDDEAREKMKKQIEVKIKNCKTDFDKYVVSIQEKTGLSLNDCTQYHAQCSATCVKNEEDGCKVVAIVGGRKGTDDKIFEFGLNRASSAPRMAGSSFKPLVVYGPAFEQENALFDKKMDPSTRLTYNRDLTKVDKEYAEIYKGRKPPQDATREQFGSSIDIETAVAKSLNTVAIQVFHNLGKKYKENNPKKCENKGVEACATQMAWDKYLKDLGFSYMAPYTTTETGYNMALGDALNNGVTTLEMAGAYSCIVREGRYIKPTCIESIEGLKEEVDNSKQSGISVYNADTTHRLNKCMKKVLQSGGTCYDKGLNNNWEAAGKTGTTDNDENAWMCGFTKQYTTTVWAGYETDNIPSKGKGLDSRVHTGGIWKNFMDYVHKDIKFDPEKDKLIDTYEMTDEFKNDGVYDEDADGEDGENVDGDNIQDPNNPQGHIPNNPNDIQNKINDIFDPNKNKRNPANDNNANDPSKPDQQQPNGGQDNQNGGNNHGGGQNQGGQTQGGQNQGGQAQGGQTQGGQNQGGQGGQTQPDAGGEPE